MTFPRFLAAVLLAVAAGAQAPATFAAAAVKPHPDNLRTSIDFRIEPGGRLYIQNLRLDVIVREAFAINPNQLEGGPGWMRTEHFDIEGVPPGPASREQTLEMLQSLLATRFRLKVEKLQRPVKAYALIVGSGKPKLGPADATAREFIATTHEPGPNSTYSNTLTTQNASMGDLAAYLWRASNTEVTDATGILGNISFTAHFSPPGADGDPAWPPLLAAVQEQLGLKLAVRPSTLTVLRVVRLEHPSVN